VKIAANVLPQHSGCNVLKANENDF
jgi:hypothetical protein